jgi:hypothetical protein
MSSVSPAWCGRMPNTRALVGALRVVAARLTGFRGVDGFDVFLFFTSFKLIIADVS